MDTLIPTERTKLARRPGRGSYDRALIHAILDEALICHLAFEVDGQPYALPTTHARVGDRLFVHGSVASRMLHRAKSGAPVCVTATLIDGLVLARSAMHHSMNYRSVVVLGEATLVHEAAEKRAALEALVEHVAPGRSREVRPPSEAELNATLVLSLPIHEASAKVRSGPPIDDEADCQGPWWAGVLPVQMTFGSPQPDPQLQRGIAVPPSVLGYRRGP